MNNAEARAVLSVYREGERDERFDKALRLTQSDSELSTWWKEEQKLDEAIGAKLESIHFPAGLKERISAGALPVESSRTRRFPGLLAAAAAALIALAVIAGLWRKPVQPPGSLADFRDEMTSFVSVDPSLELKSNDLSRITDWLGNKSVPANLALPKKLSELEPFGCRTLRYRGYDVALVCFRRDNGQLAHIFALNRRAFPNLPDRGSPQFASNQGWTSASWADGDYAYVMTAKGDRAALERYL